MDSHAYVLACFSSRVSSSGQGLQGTTPEDESGKERAMTTAPDLHALADKLYRCQVGMTYEQALNCDCAATALDWAAFHISELESIMATRNQQNAAAFAEIDSLKAQLAKLETDNANLSHDIDRHLNHLSAALNENCRD
jgi:hypothetical protein